MFRNGLVFTIAVLTIFTVCWFGFFWGRQCVRTLSGTPALGHRVSVLERTIDNQSTCITSLVSNQLTMVSIVAKQSDMVRDMLGVCSNTLHAVEVRVFEAPAVPYTPWDVFTNYVPYYFYSNAVIDCTQVAQ